MKMKGDNIITIRFISNDEMIYKYEGCDPFEDEKSNTLLFGS